MNITDYYMNLPKDLSGSISKIVLDRIALGNR